MAMTTTMATMTTMATTMATFGESRCWCQHQRQAHGSSGCGPNDLLMVTTKSGTAGAVLARLDNRGHLHVRSVRKSGLLVGHEGYCPSQQREHGHHHKQRSVFSLVALAWPGAVRASLVASLQVEPRPHCARCFLPEVRGINRHGTTRHGETQRLNSPTCGQQVGRLRSRERHVTALSMSPSHSLVMPSVV